MTHIAIVGQMGVGKSTLGRALGSEMGRPYCDSDADLEKFVALTAAEYAVAHGREALHAVEAEQLLARLAESAPLVISAAGSTIEDEACRSALRHAATVIWLDAPAEQVVQRAVGGAHRRYLSIEDVVTLDVRRRPLYEGVADLRVDATQSAEAVLRHAMRGIAA